VKIERRRLLQGGLIAAGGALVGAAGVTVPRLFESSHLPFDGGYAPAADRLDLDRAGRITIAWHVDTTEPVLALTFDDGPGPRYTSLVLDALDAHQASATFFMVGSRLAEHPELIRNRMDRHEIGNHTWSHVDLAKLDAETARREIGRTHETIQRITGREAHLLRPPYGHLGGSTLLAADHLGYDVVLWSHQMHEQTYRHNPAGQVHDIVANTGPGQIVLAHDVGTPDRLVSIRHLGEMIAGLRQRGIRLVTVSELLSLGRVVPAPGGHAGPGAEHETVVRAAHR
jgi:peptidoglycan/xylan/chitin deacetylase (PgdA/CDA1 family)